MIEDVDKNTSNNIHYRQDKFTRSCIQCKLSWRRKPSCGAWWSYLQHLKNKRLCESDGSSKDGYERQTVLDHWVQELYASVTREWLSAVNDESVNTV